MKKMYFCKNKVNMRSNISVLLFFVLHFVCIKSNAQVVENPVFDRTDVSTFRVVKVFVDMDTTYICCSYQAEDSSWANISSDTYLEDIVSGTQYRLLKVSGLPFSPEKKHFTDKDTIQVLLCFPHISTKKFNIIENEHDIAFNIYGIDLNNSYSTAYTAEDIAMYYNYAIEEEEKEKWQSAIYYYLLQLKSAKFVEGVRSLSSACAMFNLTLDYFYTNEYEKVIEWGDNAIDILCTLPQDSITLDILARTYGNVSTAYQLLNQHEKEIQYKELSLATRRLGEGIGAISYEKYLQDMAKLYYYEDNFPKALLYGREVVDVYKTKYEENSEYGCVYVNSLNNLSEFCQRMDKFEEAIYYSKLALRLIKEGACQDSINTLWLKNVICCNLAGALATIGEVDDAINYLEDVVNTNGYKGENSRDVINARMLLADILLHVKQDSIRALNEYDSLFNILSDSIAVGKKYYPEYTEILQKLYQANMWKDSNRAMQYLDKLIKAQKEWNGEESVAYGNSLLEYVGNIDVMGESISRKKDVSKYVSYLKQASDIIKRHMNNSMYNMSRADRLRYWQRYKWIYEWCIPTAIIIGTNEMRSMAYNAALFKKGMLLSSEREFKDVIKSSQDNDLTCLYKEYIDNLSLLEKQYSSTQSKEIIDSLKNNIRKQEYILSQKATRFNRFFKGTNYSWENVKNNLKSDDIAIEIVSYYNADFSEVFYDAYVIDSESAYPEILFWFNDKQLNDCVVEGRIDYKKLYELTWGNGHLENMIKDKKNIYFSASGQLNSLGIEYLPIADGQLICDKYNIYRLSSTRELCYTNNFPKTERACLYGGLDYNFARQDIVYNNELCNRVSRAVVDSIMSRGGFDPLYGSRKEIDQIKNELTRNSIHCDVYTDSEGTEESFKKLSGSKMNIIHLSTHGMYVSNKDESAKRNHFHFVISEEVPDVDEESRSLSRSFLVMSGGNRLLRKDTISDANEDGILTALEISHLDFSDLDLVVLSACETALGEIDSEGVYGLQRAFKKAGANTILMSLGKVDDEATQILMTEFYKNLISGKSKHQSLKYAQKYLRVFDNGKYDKPEYWASFIMLDGLN